MYCAGAMRSVIVSKQVNVRKIKKENAMKRAMLMAVAIGALLMFSGCATSRGPKIMSAEIKQKAKRVSIEKEVHAPASFPFQVSGGGGVIAAAIIAKKQESYNREFSEKVDPSTFLSETLRKTFAAKLSASRDFIFTDDKGAAVDASFVLDVLQIDLVPDNALSLSARFLSQATVVVTLISNPPFDLIRDRNGRLITEDPTRHVVLYEKVVVGDNRQQPRESRGRHINYYKDNVRFESTFGCAISNAVDKIVADW